jgi:cytochrome c2
MQAVTRGLRLALPLLLALGALTGCDREDEEMDRARFLTGGNAQRGATLIRSYGCGACHTIPGIPGANTTVGPNLEGLKGRMYIAGVLPNEPGNLIEWIHDPQAISPKTAMPRLGVTRADARDIATYLYSTK